MEKVGPNSKFVGHSTKIIWQSKIKGSLKKNIMMNTMIMKNMIILMNMIMEKQIVAFMEKL